MPLEGRLPRGGHSILLQTPWFTLADPLASLIAQPKIEPEGRTAIAAEIFMIKYEVSKCEAVSPRLKELSCSQTAVLTSAGSLAYAISLSQKCSHFLIELC